MTIPLAITIRSKNGQFNKMAQSVQEIRIFMSDPKFFEKDVEHSIRFIKRWAELRAEWLRGKAITSTRLDEEVYMCGSDESMELAPKTQGLILIDYVTNTIHSMQNLIEVSWIAGNQEGSSGAEIDTRPWEVVDYLAEGASPSKAKTKFRETVEMMTPLNETEQAIWCGWGE
jgi:hypothetical protein